MEELQKTIENVPVKEIAAKLSEQFPCDPDTILRASAETIEHVNAGFPVPSDKRIIVEDWGEFVLIHVTSVHLRTGRLHSCWDSCSLKKSGTQLWFSMILTAYSYKRWAQPTQNAERGTRKIFVVELALQIHCRLNPSLYSG
jgi:hypothetical protein